MGIYVNPGNEGFATSRRSRYVDKTGLIAVVNETIGKQEKLTCISRPRRFGKSYAAKMLCAYYDKTCNSAALFDDMKISEDPSYREHLNKYDVIYLDITTAISEAGGLDKIVPFIRRQVTEELMELYPGLKEAESFSRTLEAAVELTGNKMIAIIDEWDAPIRARKSTEDIQYEYLEFLRSLFKSSSTTDKVFAAAYITGILPIKKDGSQSAISEFKEYTILSPGPFAPYVGFLESEVRDLCGENEMDFEEMKRWYDGYTLPGIHSVYNPNSVMEAIRCRSYESYWSRSSAAMGLLDYVNLDYNGISKTVTDLMAGIEAPVNVRTFKNDLTSFQSADDVLTLLTHFGYFSYNKERGTIRIPNEEIRIEFGDSLHGMTHADTIRRVKESDQLIQDTVNENAEAVAAQLQKVHTEGFVPRLYNKEESLRNAIKLAYFAYKDYYVQMEELAGGTGYADVVYLPKKYSDMPALVVELKALSKDHPENTAEGAIAQIKSRNYPDILKDYGSEILLVGISYDSDDPKKTHHCVIELNEGGVF